MLTYHAFSSVLNSINRKDRQSLATFHPRINTSGTHEASYARPANCTVLQPSISLGHRSSCRYSPLALIVIIVTVEPFFYSSYTRIMSSNDAMELLLYIGARGKPSRCIDL